MSWLDINKLKLPADIKLWDVNKPVEMTIHRGDGDWFRIEWHQDGHRIYTSSFKLRPGESLTIIGKHDLH